MVQGDFDGDGRMDVMHLDDGGNFMLARGQSDGSFQVTQPVADFTIAEAVFRASGNLRTGDFNADGKTDLLYLSRTPTKNWLALSCGNNTFEIRKGAQLGVFQNVGISVGFTLAGDAPLYSTMIYDAVGRETQQTDPGGRVTTTTFNGLATSVTNPNLQTVSSSVNAMGWTVQTTDTANKFITRSYDAYGSLRFVTDSASNTTELRYDQRGNKVWMREPNSGTSTFTYNGFGELKTQTNAAGQTVSMSYDLLGRVMTRSEPEGVSDFIFDTAAKGIGQLASESGPDFPAPTTTISATSPPAAMSAASATARRAPGRTRSPASAGGRSTRPAPTTRRATAPPTARPP